MFGLGALGLLGGALSHVVRGLTPGDPDSGARHALFVTIDVLAALGVWRRPRWFVLPFACLTLQQMTTHGAAAAQALQAGGAPQPVDAIVTLGLPLLLAALVWDAWRPLPEPGGET
ncbi:MAG TPA: hypothetical protein DEA08_11510 [Planctomycetes bacterium]|nr:hypothetical protein [Planctomycetota bacterium]